MERVADRESHRNQQQGRQNTAECRCRQMIASAEYSSRLHDNTCNQAHPPSQRKLDLPQPILDGLS
jgi:hypothetical protein